MFIPVEKTHSDILIKEGSKANFLYIISSGEVKVSRQGKDIAVLSRGDFIGSMQKIHRDEPEDYTFSNEKPVTLFAMKAEEILRFADKNPGLLMKIVYDF